MWVCISTSCYANEQLWDAGMPRQFDLKNHPQNHVPDVRDNPAILNPRPDTGGRNLTWSQASTAWGSTDKYWNLI